MTTENLLAAAEIIWFVLAAVMLIPLIVSKVKKQAKLMCFFLGLAVSAGVYFLIGYLLEAMPILLLPPITSFFLIYVFEDEDKDYSVFYGIAYSTFTWLMYMAFMQIDNVNFHISGVGSERWGEFNNAYEIAAKSLAAPFICAAVMLWALFLYINKQKHVLAFWLNCIAAESVLFLFLI